MKNDGLSARLLSAAVILVTLFTLMWLDFQRAVFGVSGAWLLPLLLVVSVLATEEVLSLLRAQNYLPRPAIIYATNLALPTIVSWPILVQLGHWNAASATASVALAWVPAALGVCTMAAFIGEMARYAKPGTAIVNVALSVFTMIYIGVCLSFWASLRLHHHNSVGMVALFSLLLIVKTADVGAFACGKCFGRHKLTPVLSPGKTWEGALGGLVTACLVSWAFFRFAAPLITGLKPASVASALAYGGSLAIAGMIGDLAESLLKRDMQRKDSSSWLPGLGGVLDIIDAPLLAGPVAWLFWNFNLM